MAPSIVVGSIFVATDQLLGTEKITVGTSANLIDGRWIKIDEDGTGNIFAAGGFSKESLVRSAFRGFVGNIGIDKAIRLQTMFK